MVFNKEKITKLLNTLKEKDYSKDTFTKKDYGTFILCLVHSKKPYAKDVVIELVDIFKSINYIEGSYQELLNSLIVAIKYHFKDDIEKLRRLIRIAIETMEQEEVNILPDIIDDRIAIMNRDKENSSLQVENYSLKTKYSSLETRYSSLETENEELKKRLKELEKDD